MSGQQTFSNADTGNKHPDPYTEKNKEDDISLKDKIEEFKKFTSSMKFGMMTTRQANDDLLVSRCMAIAGTENGGIDLVFSTNTESGKTDDLASDSNTNIAFLNSSDGSWASVAGKSSVVTDRALVEKHYSRTLKAWIGDLGDGVHDGGPKDPRIGAILVHAKSITYAVATGTAVGRIAEIAKGTVTGSAPNVNRLVSITPQEVETFRKSQSLVS